MSQYTRVVDSNTSSDFQIHQSDVMGITLIEPMNIDSYNYVVDELNLHVMDDGYLPLDTDKVEAFVESCESAHLWTAVV